MTMTYGFLNPFTGRRHRTYKRGVNKTHPFELGIGYYYQMDIMLKPEVAQNAIPNIYTNIRWPNAIVPYVITGNFCKFMWIDMENLSY